jgi:ATP-dependent DNA helicase RecQ
VQKRAWTPAGEALRRWRAERARAEGVPAYVVFPDRTIEEIVARRPGSPAELAAIHGLGPSRLARFGQELAIAVEDALALPATAPPAVAAAVAAPHAASGAAPAPLPPEAQGLYAALAAWRRSRAVDEDVPPFHVFHNSVLDRIARARPRSREELAAVQGVGPSKLDRYGDDVLEVVATA